VEVGNEWGFAIDEAARLPFAALLMVGHPGKLAKLTAGGWDTHSGRSGSALPIVAEMHAAILGRPAVESPTVEGVFAALDQGEKKRLGDTLAAAIQKAVGDRTAGRLKTAVVLIDLGGRTLGEAGDLTPWG
jgi:cobalt-precorrin-5B (C1)-methyltransferase